MKNPMLVVTIFLLVWICADGFRIGAFNVQIFGATKAKKPEVMSTLALIIQEYDILLVQEIRDIKQTAIWQLLKQTNDLGLSTYDLVISARLGRTNNKEQYAFLYRNNTGIRVMETYQYPDVNDEFEREPYAVRFRSPSTTIREFVLAGVHVDPDTAVQEINSLVTVHADLQRHWETDNILIMGDFNADCRYVGKRALKTLELKAEKFHWLIGDDVDTTTKSTDCAYDRFVMTGRAFLESVVQDTPDIYRYDLAYNLSSIQTTAVSDHFPIELELHTLVAGSLQASSSAGRLEPLGWFVWDSLQHWF